MSEVTTPQANEHVVARESDFQPGDHKIVKVRSLEIGLYRIKDTFYALHNLCPHQFGPACLGTVTGQTVCDETTDWHFTWARAGEILTCPWHGIQFDITTGQCLPNKNLKLRSFPVRVVDGEVLVRVGGPQPTKD